MRIMGDEYSENKIVTDKNLKKYEMREKNRKIRRIYIE